MPQELAKCKLSAAALRIGVLGGKRFDAAAALQCGMVDATHPLAVCRWQPLRMRAFARDARQAATRWIDAAACSRFSAHGLAQELAAEAGTMAAGLLPSALKLANFDPKMYSAMKVELYTDGAPR